MSQTTVLVTGGAGFTGCVLSPMLLERGYDVRVLDCLWWGEGPLAAFRDRIDLVEGDVRDLPPSVLDGVDAVVHLAALSNDPTAEHDPAANWEIGAVATEELGRACLERGIRRFVFTSSASLYDGLPEGLHDETARVEPVGEYATAKRYAEERLHRGGTRGSGARDHAQRHALRLEPADALRPRRQHLSARCADPREAEPARRRLDVPSASGRSRRRQRDRRGAGGARRRRLGSDLQRAPLEPPDPRAGDGRGRLAADAGARGGAGGSAGADDEPHLRAVEREARRAGGLRARATRCSTASRTCSTGFRWTIPGSSRTPATTTSAGCSSSRPRPAAPGPPAESPRPRWSRRASCRGPRLCWRCLASGLDPDGMPRPRRRRARRGEQSERRDATIRPSSPGGRTATTGPSASRTTAIASPGPRGGSAPRLAGGHRLSDEDDDRASRGAHRRPAPGHPLPVRDLHRDARRERCGRPTETRRVRPLHDQAPLLAAGAD